MGKPEEKSLEWEEEEEFHKQNHRFNYYEIANNVIPRQNGRMRCFTGGAGTRKPEGARQEKVGDESNSKSSPRREARHDFDGENYPPTTFNEFHRKQ